MSSPFVGEIIMFGGNFAIAGWAFCNGSQMSISQNDTLYNLIGTTYGGDGVNFFNLPDLRSRIPVGMGTGQGLQTYVIGQTGGLEEVTLSIATLPSHNHQAMALPSNGNSGAPAGNVVAWAQPSSGNSRYSSGASTGTMNQNAIGGSGGSTPHENMLPFQCINYIISLYGIYPPRN